MGDEVDLRIALFAKGVEVASSSDPSIWVSAMALITGVKPLASERAKSAHKLECDDLDVSVDGDDAIAKFAQEIGVSPVELEGAAGPSRQAPFIHLDHKYWEALKSTPGFASTAPPVLAATLLLLWDRHTKIGDITLKTCGEALKTIDLTTKNASRGFKNCDWLQIRGSLIKLNPALISKAEKLAATYCRSRSK
jgi:hypothetical protein